jgi:signal transduction histidine kinase
MRQAMGEVRRLVEGLRPPALDELGLAGAIRAHADRLVGLVVTVEAPGQLPPLPAAVEVAVYRIATEALTNVIRHAAARRCAILLRVGDDVELEVIDDGRGLLPARRGRGFGLDSMRERAAELGGTCVTEPGPDAGTRVRLRLPVTLEVL